MAIFVTVWEAGNVRSSLWRTKIPKENLKEKEREKEQNEHERSNYDVLLLVKRKLFQNMLESSSSLYYRRTFVYFFFQIRGSLSISMLSIVCVVRIYFHFISSVQMDKWCVCVVVTLYTYTIHTNGILIYVSLSKYMSIHFHDCVFVGMCACEHESE